MWWFVGVVVLLALVMGAAARRRRHRLGASAESRVGHTEQNKSIGEYNGHL